MEKVINRIEHGNQRRTQLQFRYPAENGLALSQRSYKYGSYRSCLIGGIGHAPGAEQRLFAASRSSRDQKQFAQK